MKTDIERLLGWFASGDLIRPSAGTANTVDLARAMASLAGAPDLRLGENATAIAELAGPAGHYVFVLADGLGMNLVEDLPADCFLRRNLAMELRAVFPPTTAAALTSLATGLWPGEHAVPAWWTHLPEHGMTATILPFIERFSGRRLGDLGIEPDRAFPKPSLMSRFQLDVHSFMPSAIAGSTYSRYFTGETPMSGYESLGEAMDAVLRRIEGAGTPTYSYVYYPAIDAAEHLLGPDAEEVRAGVMELDRQLSRLAEGLAGRARVVLSADHGAVRVPDELRHRLDGGDELLETLTCPPSGEPRVPFFHIKPGRAEEFRGCFQERFEETHALISIDEVDGLRLFGPGPLSGTARGRIGDAIAITDGPGVLVYEPAMLLRGYHGGLTPAEMRIPLIVA